MKPRRHHNIHALMSRKRGRTEAFAAKMHRKYVVHKVAAKTKESGRSGA